MKYKNRFYVEDGHLDKIENFIICKEVDNKLIYEVIRIMRGVPLFLEGHIDRLENSFNLEGLTFLYKTEKVTEYIESLVEANNIENGNIKIVFESLNETLKVFQIKHNYPTTDMHRSGVSTILYHGERKNPNAKVVDDSFRSKVNSEIEKANAYEAILVNNNGNISEGSRSNIFFIKENELFTAPVLDVLPGITRMEIIKMAHDSGINVNEVGINFETLKEYDAAFICGTSPNILPIKNIDNINMNVDNMLLHKLVILFNDKIDEYILNDSKQN